MKVFDNILYIEFWLKKVKNCFLYYINILYRCFIIKIIIIVILMDIHKQHFIMI